MRILDYTLMVLLTSLPAWSGNLPLSQRSPQVRQRAMAMGYKRVAVLEQWQEEKRKAIESLVDTRNGFETARWEQVPTGKRSLFGRVKTQPQARYKIDPDELASAQQVLSHYPELRQAGEALARDFAGESAHPRVAEYYRRIRDLAYPKGESPATAQRAKLDRAEAELIGKLDEHFIHNYPRLLQALDEKPPEELAHYGMSLVHQLNSWATDKEIRKEQVAQGHAEGATEIAGHFRGPLGGNRGGFSGHGEFHADYRANQLLLASSHYTVRFKDSQSPRKLLRDRTAVGRVDARQIAELAVEATLVTRALERRAPQLAGALSGWLNHSKIDFVDGSTKVTVDLSRADADVPRLLVGSGVVSKTFATTLDRNRERGMGDRMDTHPLLDH